MTPLNIDPNLPDVRTRARLATLIAGNAALAGHTSVLVASNKSVFSFHTIEGIRQTVLRSSVTVNGNSITNADMSRLADLIGADGLMGQGRPGFSMHLVFKEEALAFTFKPVNGNLLVTEGRESLQKALTTLMDDVAEVIETTRDALRIKCGNRVFYVSAVQGTVRIAVHDDFGDRGIVVTEIDPKHKWMVIQTGTEQNSPRFELRVKDDGLIVTEEW